MIIQNFPFIRGLLVDKREIVCYTVIYVKKKSLNLPVRAFD